MHVNMTPDWFHYMLKTNNNLIRIKGPGHAKTCLMSYANNKGADQPAHPRTLISTFVVRCLDSMICILAISKRLRILAGFCSWAGCFESYLVKHLRRHIFAWCGSFKIDSAWSQSVMMVLHYLPLSLVGVQQVFVLFSALLSSTFCCLV